MNFKNIEQTQNGVEGFLQNKNYLWRETKEAATRDSSLKTVSFLEADVGFL